jgi:Tfp pilus assembly protein PilN
MKPIRIDLAPRSIKRTIAQVRSVTLLLGCVGLLLTAAAILTSLDLLGQYRTLQAELRHTESQLAKYASLKPVQKKFVDSEAQAGAVNGAIAQLNLPWRDVFDAIEAATPAKIALLALEPDAKKHTIKGLAEAKTSDGMIAYIERLKQQSFFGAVMLTRHETNEQDPNTPIRFQFEAQWTDRGQ